MLWFAELLLLFDFSVSAFSLAIANKSAPEILAGTSTLTSHFCFWCVMATHRPQVLLLLLKSRAEIASQWQ